MPLPSIVKIINCKQYKALCQYFVGLLYIVTLLQTSSVLHTEKGRLHYTDDFLLFPQGHSRMPDRYEITKPLLSKHYTHKLKHTSEVNVLKKNCTNSDRISLLVKRCKCLTVSIYIIVDQNIYFCMTTALNISRVYWRY